MTARPDPEDFALDAFVQQQEQKGLLRLIVCGSVDHGKSTLIGRLLYEAKVLFDDQLDTLASESRKFGTLGHEPDFSLLLDGLAAEREQKITIDVAYRFFSTDRRKFIVADAPGHEHYTRNMATGASTADVALILVDASGEITRQTKRHSLIVSSVGVRRFIVAVNKMDREGWSEQSFRAVEERFRAFARGLEVDEMVFIPISARHGDNVVSRSANMDWYDGPTLLDQLEQVEVGTAAEGRPFRMPVQLVNRPNSDFRGYSGLIASGEIRAGAAVQVLPSGQTTRIARIVTADGDLDRAFAGQSVTLTLADDIDASRGDVIAEAERPAPVTNRLTARIVWMGSEPLVPGQAYQFKLATSTATATVEPGVRVLDLDSGRTAEAQRLVPNDIGQCVLQLDRPVAFDRYAPGLDTGCFILIDRETFDTVAMGMVIDSAGQPAERTAPNSQPAATATRRGWRWPMQAGESHARSLVKAISWRATGSLDTFVLSWLITGNKGIAASIAGTEIITKILIYYFHERVWAVIPWGKRPGGSGGGPKA